MEKVTGSDVAEHANGWKNTKEAVANFKQMLLCSKCSDLMQEPVCLGTCEHMLCRSCAGPRAGDGCAVCRSPAWVKDVQINRPLSSIVHVFRTLEALLAPAQTPDSSLPDAQTPTESRIFRQKKNIKICFSPRSRKVRCTMEKPAEPRTGADGGSGAAAAATHSASASTAAAAAAPSKDMTVFNFTTSSQDSASSGSGGRRADSQSRKRKSSTKKAAPRRAAAAATAAGKQVQRKVTKNLLEALNQQWGITEEANAAAAATAEEPRKTSKRVSFQSPDDTPAEPQGGAPPPNHAQEASERVSHETPTTNEPDAVKEKPDGKETPKPDGEETPKPDGEETPKPAAKRPRTEANVAAPLEATPKRPRASAGRGRRSAGRMSPSVLNPPSPGSATPQRSARTPSKEQGQSRSRSPAAPRKSPSTPGSASASASPSVSKKNHRGETPLHLAAIKGDAAAAEELLEQGADPNLKDHAGWTPLHEACNLGHLGVVELLLSRGALLNTPGYDNDSPLHDAVRNGHTAVAKLLLEQGASQNVLNLSGKRPVDYAAAPEMRQIFREASEDGQNAKASPGPSAASAASPAASECVRREAAVLLSSGLTRAQRQQLIKLGRLLEARTTDTFSGSVSHIVVPEGAMPTSSSALLGLLAGCWVVKYSWVEACLRAGRWTPEGQHEAGDGPQRSRTNRASLLPRLLDGCFFFLQGSFGSPSRAELGALLAAAGGQLLSRRPKPDSDVTQTLSAAAYHAAPDSDQALCTQYILYEAREGGARRPAALRRGKVWWAPSSWLLDCIAAFRLLPVPDPQASS